MKTILIAEDDANIRTGLVDLFESEGYRVCAVGDGQAALAAHHKAPNDLILLDVMMPEKSGYDVCREIRKSNSDVPIIMLTAKGEEVDKVVGLQLGADDYVTKPFGV
ncbi:MAG: response regulator, partial [Pontiellaceae bacterium]|nr:response regulator [Pontiellaceae bacterium]